MICWNQNVPWEHNHFNKLCKPSPVLASLPAQLYDSLCLWVPGSLLHGCSNGSPYILHGALGFKAPLQATWYLLASHNFLKRLDCLEQLALWPAKEPVPKLSITLKTNFVACCRAEGCKLLGSLDPGWGWRVAFSPFFWKHQTIPAAITFWRFQNKRTANV